MAASIVQFRVGKAASSAAFSTAAMTTTSGNTLLLISLWEVGSATRPTYVDSKGNTLVPIGPIETVTNSGFTSAIAYSYVAGDNMVGGASHTVQQAAGSYGTMILVEIAGADPTNPIAGVLENNDTASPFVGASFTPTVDDALIFSAIQAGDSAAYSVSAPFSIVQALNYPADVTYWGMALASMLQSGAAAAVTPTWTASGGFQSSLLSIAIKPAAAAGRTATLNATIPGPALSANGRVAIAATFNATIPGPVLASTARVAIKATLAATIPGPTLAASASVQQLRSASANVTIPGPTLAAAASVRIGATFNATIPGPTLSALGKLLVQGNGDAFVPGPTLLASARVAIAASVSVTIPGPTLQASGTMQALRTAQLNATIPGPTLQADARVAISGAFAAIIAGPSLQASAAVGRAAAFNATIPGPSLQAVGVLSEVILSPQTIELFMPARNDTLLIDARPSAFTIPKR